MAHLTSDWFKLRSCDEPTFLLQAFLGNKKTVENFVTNALCNNYINTIEPLSCVALPSPYGGVRRIYKINV